MGTRHLIAIVKDGQHKLAQYGQWDGYPEGQGATVLAFLSTVDLDKFSQKVDFLDWVTDEDEARQYHDAGVAQSKRQEQFISMEDADKLSKAAPQLSRDTSAKVLDMIYEATDRLPVRDAWDFALDSLFCEFAYVIDLDTRTFEAYEGFQKGEVKGRWAGQQANEEHRGDDQYSPVTLVASWSLTALPSEAEFLAAFPSVEED